MSATEGTVMDDARLEQASEWFVRLREPTVSTDDIASWLQWCQAHPDNEPAYRQIQEIWSMARDSGVGEWPNAEEVRGDTYDGEASIGEWISRDHATPSVATPATATPAARAAMFPTVGRSRRSLLKWSAVGLAASAVLAVGSWVLYDRGWLSGPGRGVYSTQRAEKRELLLADGSRVILGGASRIRVAYSEGRRDIALEEGEAFFKVKHDPQRPFVVQAPNLRVTAVGTAFTVRADDVRTVVAVTDGVVDVEHPVAQQASTFLDRRTSVGDERPISGLRSMQATSPTRTRAGQQLTFDGKIGATSIRPTDEALALGWQDGALSYVDEPLRSVVARVNRYSQKEIVLGDAKVGELRFTGTVLEGQVDEWIRGLEQVFSVRAAEGAHGSVRLEAP